MKIVYQQGTDNKADGLSRRTWNEDRADEDVKPSKEGGGGKMSGHSSDRQTKTYH